MRRVIWYSIVALIALGAVSCGGNSEGGGSLEPVETDVTIPQGDKHAFELSGKFSETVSGKSTSVIQRNGETTVDISGVGPGDLTSVRFVFEGQAGTTGTVATIKTAQLTRSSSQYTNSEPLRVTLKSYDDSEIVGAMAGAFTEKARRSGGKQSLDEPIRIEGRFNFSYGN